MTKNIFENLTKEETMELVCEMSADVMLNLCEIYRVDVDEDASFETSQKIKSFFASYNCVTMYDIQSLDTTIIDWILQGFDVKQATVLATGLLDSLDISKIENTELSSKEMYKILQDLQEEKVIA